MTLVLAPIKPGGDADYLPRRRVDSDGLVTRYAHDERGAIVRIEFSSGVNVAIAYDERGRVRRLDDAEGTLRTLEYDHAHNVVAEVDAAGARTTYGYDALGRVVSRTDALGRTSRIVRDALGRPVTLVGPEGSTVQRAYDARGNVVREVDPGGGVTTMAYPGMGTITQLVTPDGRRWRFEYTSNERIKRIVNPKGEVYEFVYDLAGRIVKERGFDGRLLEYVRGLDGLVERAKYPDGTHRSFRYDRSGRMLADVASDGSAIAYGRDARGRITAATWTEGSTRHHTAFERDPLGRITLERQGDRVFRYAYDAFGRVVERISPLGERTAYEYGRAHALRAVVQDGKRIEVRTDAVGRETGLGPSDGSFAVAFEYDALDRVLEERIVRRAPGQAPATEVLRQFAWDRPGRPVQLVDGRWGIDRFTHDGAGRLLQVLRETHREAFRYDPSNSVVARSRQGEPSEPWTLAPGGQVLKTDAKKYAYDARGRRVGFRHLGEDGGREPVTEYVWDVRDRLREVRFADGRRAIHAYDAFGRKVRTEHRGEDGVVLDAVELLWSGNALAAEVRADRRRSFVHRPGTLYPLLHVERGELFLYVHDHLGTPRELVDMSGRVAWAADYGRWGELRAEAHDPARQNAGRTVSSPFRRLGQVADEVTGLVWTRFRVFDPETARWLSADPLGVWGGMNLYGFGGNPVADVDPFGLAHTRNQSALNDLARTAERRPARGQAPLSHDDAQTMIDGADETGLPVRASAADLGAAGPSHWEPVAGQPTPHVHINGHHVPVQPGFVPRGGFR